MMLSAFTVLIFPLLVCLLFAGQNGKNMLAYGQDTEEENGVDGADGVPKKPRRTKKTSDWRKANFQNIEKEWESGDDETELEMEMDHQMKINQRKNQVNWDDPEAVKKMLNSNKFGLQGGASGKMLFISLKPTQVDGKPWDKKAMDKLSANWQSLLQTASLTGKLYNIGDNQLLINIEKTYMMDDVIKFILQRQDTLKITMDNKDYLPSQVLKPDEDEDDEL